MKKLRIIIVIASLLISYFIYAQSNQTESGPSKLASLDIYAKVIGVVLTGLGTIFGLPLAIMNFKKTKAEIRKLEREAEAMSLNKTDEIKTYAGYKINIEN